jgi:hypothetical protein
MAPILGILASQNYPRITNSYESIATVTLGSAASTINFSSIPSTYQHLQLRIIGRGSRALFLDNVRVTFNGDGTTSNYYQHAIYGDGTSITASSDATSYNLFYSLAGNNAASNVFGAMIIDIFDYANTNKNKTSRALGGVDNNGTGIVGFGSGGWFSTSAINAIQLQLSNAIDFLANSQVALYGIRG